MNTFCTLSCRWGLDCVHGKKKRKKEECIKLYLQSGIQISSSVEGGVHYHFY